MRDDDEDDETPRERRRRSEDDDDEPRERRRRSEDDDDDEPRERRRRRRPAADLEDAELTTVDWVLIVLCSGIACIIGIVRLIQGKPSAGKMIGFSLLFIALWTIIRIGLTAAMKGAP